MPDSLARSEQTGRSASREYTVVSGKSANIIAIRAQDRLRPALPDRAQVLSRCPTRKRVFDVVGAVLIGVVSLPLIIAVSLVILASGRPIIYKHWRVGRDKKRFACYKFRTMVPDANERLARLLSTNLNARREWELNHKLRDDPRVTRFGAFLRQSSIDELPQLLNVIKGEMSLVGPRPVVEDELARYGNRVAYYQSVRPGITGLWQVSGRNDVTYSRRVAFDTLYVRRRSLALDFWILLRTFQVVIAKVGAY